MLLSLVRATAAGHKGVWMLPDTMLMPMGGTAARDHIGVHGQGPTEIMLMFLTCAATKGLRWCLWPELHQRSVLMSAVI